MYSLLLGRSIRSSSVVTFAKGSVMDEPPVAFQVAGR